jgi:putative protein-disulfide isomerase
MARVEVSYFTDPYCSWCCATEPMLYRIQETYRKQVHIRYVMGGLVKDMAEFYDALNDIRTTARVAPHWRMVSERSGQPIDEGLMEEITDPHFSTWPACIAVKAAQLQGEKVGERFLRRLRRAALTERKVISYREVQEALAREVDGLDLERWRKALDSGQAERAFQEDLAECRRYGVTGFPTMLFRYVGLLTLPGSDKPVLVRGHRTFETYRKVLYSLAPTIKDHSPRPILEMLADYGPLTTGKVAEVFAQSMEEARRELEALELQGAVRRLVCRGGELWELNRS